MATEHDGSRLNSLSQLELRSLLDMRVKQLHEFLEKETHYPRRVGYIEKIVEVLNALALVDCHPGYSRDRIRMEILKINERRVECPTIQLQ